MKLCKDCEWHAGEDGKFMQCRYPKNFIIRKTDGEKEPKYLYCSTQRGDEGWLSAVLITKTCGKSGRWWEPINEHA